MSYYEISESFEPELKGAWRDYVVDTKTPPDMVFKILIINQGSQEVMAGIRSHGNRINRIARLTPNGQIGDSIEMCVKVFKDIFEYYSSLDDVEFIIEGYHDLWPPTDEVNKLVDPASHFYRDCVAFDEKENYPCQWMVEGECPHECEQFTEPEVVFDATNLK